MNAVHCKPNLQLVKSHVVMSIVACTYSTISQSFKILRTVIRMRYDYSNRQELLSLLTAIVNMCRRMVMVCLRIAGSYIKYVFQAVNVDP
jgi:hypothetical protein